ncbi:MAG: type II toxin-antitoxin system HicA family toxin [Peptococcales bacterium]
MGNSIEKLKQRLLSKPKDFTYKEASRLLNHFSYVEKNKGKTSGSRVVFYRESDKDVILLHKPHPGDEMDRGSVVALLNHLKEKGDL